MPIRLTYSSLMFLIIVKKEWFNSCSKSNSIAQKIVYNWNYYKTFCIFLKEWGGSWETKNIHCERSWKKRQIGGGYSPNQWSDIAN